MLCDGYELFNKEVSCQDKFKSKPMFINVIARKLEKLNFLQRFSLILYSGLIIYFSIIEPSSRISYVTTWNEGQVYSELLKSNCWKPLKDLDEIECPDLYKKKAYQGWPDTVTFDIASQLFFKDYVWTYAENTIYGFGKANGIFFILFALKKLIFWLVIGGKLRR